MESSDKCDFNTCFGSVICHIGKFYFKDFLKLFKIIWGQLHEHHHYREGLLFHITNYQGF
jgi:hypothetical protein